MFERLSNRLLNTLRKIQGPVLLTESNIKDTLCEVRQALLDADVSLSVVNSFIDLVKKDALGQKVNKGLTPGQELIKIIRTYLITAMGGGNSNSVGLNLLGQTPLVIFMVGLQGAGKTTSVAKLGNFLRKKNKKVLVVSTDIYRPAGVKQLEILAHKSDIDFFSSDFDQKPIDIIKLALNTAHIKFYDILLVDTVGCSHTNQSLMSEIVDVCSVAKPIETLLVVDSMIGQDAANVADAFNRLLPLTGIILTKVDGDARGGAAFSIYHITKKPIKFIGVGEGIDALEPFYPDRLVGRILGMGDVLSLIEDIEDKVDKVQVEKLVNKVKSGDDFNLFDFMNQLKQMSNMGGMLKILSKLPGISYLPEVVRSKLDDNFFNRMLVIINSMTIQERNNPKIIQGSRKNRVARGSGVKIQDVDNLLRQFFEIQNVMKKINKYGISKVMRTLHSKIFSSFSNKY
ncbi:signal recognition particle protein [Blochmannia endosymbiont of Camponotus (Colobopsis) obliquus]|uniref:signal recognition particle protein n=1 Tax=Blochmannia endosymbiont of Camponotus (Colobopsis) obliquus TaxID=1505597 RepID=UPI00061A7C56|nr:signal recognition particle protein [Blochmannia endosymbiont of Camponotus (Colobopsis) obliquus]AKC60346.1 signal recognition particle protein [Blochmannia endosymbiont of Camponotus (Colobopsis) obliquus]